MNPCLSRLSKPLPIDDDARVPGKSTQLSVYEFRGNIVNSLTAHLRGMLNEVPVQPHIVIYNLIRKRYIKAFGALLKTCIAPCLHLIPDACLRQNDKASRLHVKKNYLRPLIGHLTTSSAAHLQFAVLRWRNWLYIKKHTLRAGCSNRTSITCYRLDAKRVPRP